MKQTVVFPVASHSNYTSHNFQYEVGLWPQPKGQPRTEEVFKIVGGSFCLHIFALPGSEALSLWSA